MLKINQKVILICADFSSSAHPGDIGYIICRKPDEPHRLGIDFITGPCSIEGHNLGGRLNTNTGNWIKQSCLKEYKEEDEES